MYGLVEHFLGQSETQPAVSIQAVAYGQEPAALSMNIKYQTTHVARSL